jgi:hypothetical protein
LKWGVRRGLCRHRKVKPISFSSNEAWMTFRSFRFGPVSVRWSKVMDKNDVNSLSQSGWTSDGLVEGSGW